MDPGIIERECGRSWKEERTDRFRRRNLAGINYKLQLPRHVWLSTGAGCAWGWSGSTLTRTATARPRIAGRHRVTRRRVCTSIGSLGRLFFRRTHQGPGARPCPLDGNRRLACAGRQRRTTRRHRTTSTRGSRCHAAQSGWVNSQVELTEHRVPPALWEPSLWGRWLKRKPVNLAS